MATMTTRRAKVKVERTVKVLLPIGADGGSGALRIKVKHGNKVTVADYLVQRIGSQFGDGFQLDKLFSEDSYHVHLSNEGHSCECKGFLRWDRCKHVEALVALRDRQMI